LRQSGHAYYCFCTKEELEQRRTAAVAAGKPPMYDRRCRAIDPLVAHERVRAGEPGALRFAVPEGGVTAFEDAVFSRVEFANAELEDFVLLRSDGVPTYHLSVVADDVDMRLTHVIRGADHISNTPKQVLQYQALGEKLPVFAHLPLILGPDKSRLSKRHGATSVMAYQDMGIVPEAFRNFLGLLGWTPGIAGREILSSVELIELFSLGGISRSNAVFDNDKLAWFNTEWIRRYSPQELLPLIEEEWARAGFHSDRTGEEILATIALLQPRARTLKDFAGAFRGYFSDAYEYDTAAVAKFLADEQSRGLLVELGERYELVDEFSEAGAEELLRAFAAEKGVKAGALINGSRVALTGQGVAPSLFAVMAALGKERVTKRLKAAGSIPSAQEEARVG
jgi:glutamyl-tRNA synthetase